MERNYLIEKDNQIVMVAGEHISGGYNISAVYYKDNRLYLDEPQIEYINDALKCGYELLGIIQGNDRKEVKRQLEHMTRAL